MFFVLSGYLITSILVKNLERGTFSYGEFYSRRIRRIFPGLVLVLPFCLVIGWFVLLPDEYSRLGKYTLGSGLFASNLIFWREVGYFDVAAQSKPLLHLWSLGIEEQFYIVWPAVIVLAWKRTRNLLPVVVVLALGSFAADLLFMTSKPAATFYLPVTRAWELLIGAALACWTVRRRGALLKRKTAETVAAIGAGALIAAMALINEKVAFPGWLALLPTLGTALLIAAGECAWINRNVLSLRLSNVCGLHQLPTLLMALASARVHLADQSVRLELAE
jgi:peptidoglycan/LPS O-acetylase OafA/YrhL